VRAWRFLEGGQVSGPEPGASLTPRHDWLFRDQGRNHEKHEKHERLIARTGKSIAADSEGLRKRARMSERDHVETDHALHALRERLKAGPLTVWATVREDVYETTFGDGYYAYVERVFLKPSGAAAAVEAADEEPMTRWHIRRYDLLADSDQIQLRPRPTEPEPTTVETLALKLLDAGLIAP
jgi:hypothetical protein